MFLAIGTGMAVIGGGSIVLFDTGRPADGLLFAGGFYIVGGAIYHPSTWSRLQIEYLPQQTPMAGHILIVASTGSLWHVTIRPLLFG